MSLHDLILRGGMVVTRSGIVEADVAITNCHVTAVEPGIESQSEPTGRFVWRQTLRRAAASPADN